MQATPNYSLICQSGETLSYKNAGQLGFARRVAVETIFEACESILLAKKKRVKVDRFLKIVWKISNLYKSRRLIYKIRYFLTSGFEIYMYAIWVKCLVNKLSQVPDVNSGFIRHIVAQIR